MKLIFVILALLGLGIVIKFWYISTPLVALGAYLGWMCKKRFSKTEEK